MAALEEKDGQREKQRGRNVKWIKIRPGGGRKIIHQPREDAEVDEQRMAQGEYDREEQQQQPGSMVKSEIIFESRVYLFFSKGVFPE
ncbi:MAG: hypothetical protein ABSD57_11330 [Verrucomicrobiota bacterium]